MNILLNPNLKIIRKTDEATSTIHPTHNMTRNTLSDKPLSVTDAAYTDVGGNLAKISGLRPYKTYSARSFSFNLIVKKRDNVLF